MCGQNLKKTLVPGCSKTYLAYQLMTLMVFLHPSFHRVSLPSTISKGLKPDLQEMDLSNETH